MHRGKQTRPKFKLGKRLLYEKWMAHWKCYFVIFGIFIFPTLIWLLSKTLKKTHLFPRCIFEVLSKFHDLTKSCALTIFDSKLTTLWIILEIHTKVRFCHSLCLNWRSVVYLILLFCIICIIDYWTIVNWVYITLSFKNHHSLKSAHQKWKTRTQDP